MRPWTQRLSNTANNQQAAKQQLREQVQIGTQVAANLVLCFEHSTRSDTLQEAYPRVRAYLPFLLHSLRRLNLELNEENTYRLAGGPPYWSQEAHNARQARRAFSHTARCAILCDLTIPADIRNAWAAFEGFAGKQDNLSGLFCIPFLEHTGSPLPSLKQLAKRRQPLDWETVYRFDNSAAHHQQDSLVYDLRGSRTWKDPNTFARAISIERSRLPSSTFGRATLAITTTTQ